MFEPCLVPVRLSPRPSRPICFGDVSETNGFRSTGNGLTEAKGARGLGTGSLRTQTYFRLSLLSAEEKRQPEIRLRSYAKELGNL